MSAQDQQDLAEPVDVADGADERDHCWASYHAQT
jgi:hypothetical protein